ncbi:MAG: carboxyl transferase domain-containing protein, partial [Actinomycetes bacterium]
MASQQHNIVSPILGTIFKVKVSVGDQVRHNQEIVILESMKMEHPVEAGVDGTVTVVAVAEGDTIASGQLLISIAPGEVNPSATAETTHQAQGERADLQRYQDRRHLTSDDARPEAVARRAAKGQRTARANITDLVDDGSFVEYGSFAIAAQRQRRELDDLIRNTPADGLVGGLASVNASEFGEDASRIAVASYDYTVLAGTQGFLNHRKKDRLFSVAEQLRTPFVLFAEGGGGRPGDTDAAGVAGLDGPAFALFARLSGLVPLVGITSGYCFAGNAALLGCCDVIIATENSNIGMAGPAMIEGGGLGVVKPTDVGPIEVQTQNGVVDVRVPDEAAAVAVAKKYLGFFQGATKTWKRNEDAALRPLIPEQRTRVYDVRTVISALADIDSALELRPTFGIGILTTLMRIEGRPVGVLANNPAHLGGAIDADAADKASRFIQLCDAYDIPIVSLCDTPGFMVGPDAEHTAQVRHFGRMFVTAGSITVPWITIVLRKGYGLGAMAMAGGGFHSNSMTVSWPTGEFGGMGLEGAVRLGYSKELAAISDDQERADLEAKLIARAYEHGSALNMASHVEIDDVIDP